MSPSNDPKSAAPSWWRHPRVWIGVVLVGLVAAGLIWSRGGNRGGPGGLSFAARRGPLDITVAEGGSVQALESQEIKCEARVGYQGVKILKIVEEGYQVTEDDIRTNKVLVELDSTDLQKQFVQQEIQYQSAAASLTDAQQGYEIQANQNLSDIKAAAQKARFGRMEFEKFLGDQVAAKVIDDLGLERELAEEQTNTMNRLPAAAVPAAGPNPGPNPDAAGGPVPAGAPVAAVVAAGPGDVVEVSAGSRSGPVAIPAPAGAAVATAPPASAPSAASPGRKAAPVAASAKEEPAAGPATNEVVVDFSKYADINLLGDGGAKQKLRELEDALQVAKKEEGQADAQLAGTKRLFDKGFVPKTEYDRDEIARENARLKVQKAATERALYLKYDFSKAGEEALSKYMEAVRELNRARKAAVSKLAQAEARWRSAQAQYQVQERQRKELQEQLDKCVIRARKPGLVVYGGGGDDMFFYGGEERIREGATVRERQSIITIPDMTHMSVKVKIHESYIKKVKKGQKARITVDAFPDQVLNGEVTKVGVLPDSQNRWMNPDLKVYLTTITVEGTHDWLKPGMTAKVEIIVDHLNDVVYVPIQAVVPQAGKQVCYVLKGEAAATREVTVGQFNDEFIEVKQGLVAGEAVLLRPPEAAGAGGEAKDREKESAKPAATPNPAPAAPAPGPVGTASPRIGRRRVGRHV